MADQRRLAVHEAFRGHDFAAEVLDDRLMPQAHAKNRNFSGKSADHRERESGVFGPAGPWRNNQMRRRNLSGRVDIRFIVATNLDLGTEHEKCLDEVVGE